MSRDYKDPQAVVIEVDDEMEILERPGDSRDAVGK